jgi:hypothetical protein
MTGGVQKNLKSHFATSSKELASEAKAKKKAKKIKLGFKVQKTKSAKRAEQKRLKTKTKTKPNLEELSKEYGLSREEVNDINERIDRSKRMIIISGVSFFMVLVLIFWFINTKYSIQKVQLDNNGGIYETWNSISQNMQEQLKAIQSEAEVIDNLKDKLMATTTDELNNSESSSSTVEVLSFTSDDFVISNNATKGEEVIERLKEMIVENSK